MNRAGDQDVNERREAERQALGMPNRWAGHAPRPPHPHPVSPEELLHPDWDEALVTAGTLIHWVTSDPDALARFTAWIEHCPGDLGTALVKGVLAAVHDQLQPACPDPIT